VLYEGTPNYPDAGRPWRIAQQLNVNIFHTSPTAIRMLRKVGPDEPAKYNYHFKHMTTVGEPIEPEVWRWYREFVGKGRGRHRGHLVADRDRRLPRSTLPAINPMKPGSCGPAALGIYPVILDEDGNEVPKGSEKAGNICIRNPWPGVFQTIWGQPERFVSTYYAKYNKNPESKDWHDWPYFAGDAATQDADGYFRILGRVDDVINVAGHRLGTKELESAALMVNEVAEAAAVPVIDDIRGRVVEMYVSLKPGYAASPEIEAKVKGRDRDRHRQDRPAEEHLDRPRHAEDQVRQDHAPRDRRDLELHRHRGHHHPRQPGGRGADQAPGTERQARQGEVPRELSETELSEIKSFGSE